jgi:hypothetical protein
MNGGNKRRRGQTLCPLCSCAVQDKRRQGKENGAREYPTFRSSPRLCLPVPNHCTSAFLWCGCLERRRMCFVCLLIQPQTQTGAIPLLVTLLLTMVVGLARRPHPANSCVGKLDPTQLDLHTRPRHMALRRSSISHLLVKRGSILQ